MASHQAKTLTAEQVSKVLAYVWARSAHPLRDVLVVLLSFKAGLRVAEIAGLRWRDVTDAFGELRDDAIQVPDNIAKKGSGRTIPMHPLIHAALLWLRLGTENAAWLKPNEPIIRSINNMGPIKPNSLQRYIGRLYATLGLQGCSSHSGRRSFLTQAARVANAHGCSLRDVQRLAGHKDIETTERYVEASATIRDLVVSI
jgi:integrase/recombinase XerD